MTKYEVGSIAASVGTKKDKKKEKKSKNAEVIAPVEEVPELASFFSSSSQIFGKRIESEIKLPSTPAPVDNTVEQVVKKQVVPEADASATPKKVKKPKHKKKALEAAAEGTSESSAPKEESKGDEQAFDVKDIRTIFIGNVSLEATTADLKKFFSSCGKVESVRLRSLPVAGCKVDQAGKQNLVKKVCANKKIFVDGRDSCNAYLVFADESSIEAALKLNGSEFFKKSLRVDRKTVSMDAKRSIFVGNLSFTVTDDEVRNHFDKALRDGAESSVVESVRIIRDKATHLGKGFGYVLFVDVSTAAKALSLNETKMGKRELRVTVCGKRFKNSKGEKKPEQKFEGRRARPGAQMRLLKKRKLEPETHSTPAEKRVRYSKEGDKKDTKRGAYAPGNKGERPPFKKASGKPINKFKKKNDKSKKVAASFEKPKKPKHAARKARQALEAAQAAKSK